MATPCIPFNIRPLDCETDSITVCALEPIQVVVALNCATDSVTVCPPASGGFEVDQGTSPWVTSLDVATLTALETVTVNQGTTPWEVSGTFANPEGWAVTHAPVSGARATISKAAEVGLRHVAVAISFNVITETTAPTTTTLTVTLRDGASGAGVVLLTWRVRVSAAMTDTNVASIQLHGLNIYGSPNTAMTLEFDIGNLNTLEDVSLTGYTAVQVNGYLLS